MAPGESGHAGGIPWETVPSYNHDALFLGLMPHPPSVGYVGWVTEIDSLRIFHPGDSDHLPEHDALQGIDLALLPIDGGDLTMSTEDAVELANTLRPRWAVPMHYIVTEPDLANAYEALVDPGIEVLRLGP